MDEEDDGEYKIGSKLEKLIKRLQKFSDSDSVRVKEQAEKALANYRDLS
jgi:ATP-dependent Clp protease ATP-binding subunit ClpA